MDLTDPRIARQASDADDVASGLQVFADFIPECHTEIVSNIEQFANLGAALRDLDRAVLTEYRENGRISAIIESDLDLVARSFQLTLDVVFRIFQRTNLTTYSGQPAYRVCWHDLCEIIHAEEGRPLASRLEFYSSFFQTVLDSLYRRRGLVRIEDLRDRARVLLQRQNPSARALSYYTPEPEPVPRGRTPIRATTSAYATPYPPYAHPDPTPMPEWNPFVPPVVPEVQLPLSPTMSNSSGHTSLSNVTWSTGASNVPPHWATRIYDRRHSSTYLRDRGRPTRALGQNEPGAVNMMRADRFVQVLRLNMEDVELYAKLYWRPHDHRARILLSTRDPYGYPVRTCIPLTALKLVRAGQCLELRRRDPSDGRLAMWANLNFTTFERMVLFYSAFVAMKRQDHQSASPGMEDYFPEEKIEFAGEIEDDHYLHALRILKDKDTKCVRLEASARRGPMKDTPIWTAFVTEYVGSRQWMRRYNGRVLEVSQLHPYIFCEGYQPPRNTLGHFQLRFTSQAGEC